MLRISQHSNTLSVRVIQETDLPAASLLDVIIRPAGIRVDALSNGTGFAAFACDIADAFILYKPTIRTCRRELESGRQQSQVGSSGFIVCTMRMPNESSQKLAREMVRGLRKRRQH